MPKCITRCGGFSSVILFLLIKGTKQNHLATYQKYLP